MLTHEQVADMNPQMLRSEIAAGNYQGTTEGLAPGYMQANLVILPEKLAFEFLLFCQRNPGACPVLEVCEPGHFETRAVAEADIRTDFPRYRIYQRGVCIDEPTDITEYCRDDLVTFLLGCSFSMEEALLRAGLPLRHRAAGRSVPIYRTNIDCSPAGLFRGHMVVTMRPFPGHLVSLAVQVMSRFPQAHGAPVHVGEPQEIGIVDLDEVMFGEPPVTEPGDVFLFTPCGVTPQLAAMHSEPELMISHYPAHMLVCDVKSQDLTAS